MMIRRDSKLKLVKKVGVLVLGAALVFTQSGMSALAAGVENHEKIESEVSLEDESDVMEEATVAVVGNDEDIETSTEESSEEDTTESEETTQNSEDMQETFEMQKSCTGVTVHMSAPDGVFPEGAYFEVREVSNREEKDIDKAISEIRDSSEKVKASYNYDITIYDEDGNEIEPDTSFGQVSVTFSMDEVKDSNLQAKVYHIEGSGDELSAEELETSVSGDEITALTDGFSYYTVEFIYEGTLCYTLNGDDRVALSVILEACGIDANGEITDVESSDDTLFKGVKESGIWYICALKAFVTEESLTVTIDGKVYTIKVTDDTNPLEQIKYIVPGISGELDTDDYTVLVTTETDIELEEGKFYVVKEDCRLSGKVTVKASEGQDEAAKLILCDGKTLTAEKGITVNSTNKLDIYAQSTDDSMGALEAGGENNQAGIGGSESNAAGTIAIYGGKITATGGGNAAGIGGGNNGNGGTITINGGIVTAKGGLFAAGIGGGKDGNGGAITINGGTVTATSERQGAGIGSGYKGSIDSSNAISIYGGTVTATGGARGAGIGGGDSAANPNITINGGTVTANAGNGGAGIGSGIDGTAASGEIVIIDGTVTANGSTGGAGIGGGRAASMGKIVIYNGTVIANGSSGGVDYGGAGIGAGARGAASTDKTITIKGGDITATGYSGGAGIGGGNGSNNIGEITITDGKITARGSDGAAGIGKGKGDGTVDVSTDPKFGNITPEDLAKGNLPKIADKKPSKNEMSHEKAEDDSNSSDVIVYNEPLMRSVKGGNSITGLCTFAKQGPLCVAAFKAATPAGFREAFSFNLNLDATGKSPLNYGKKSGRLVLTIPKQYRKAGRVFAIIGIDRKGKVKIFYDNDTSDETFTTNLNMDGYAFSVIYSSKTI